MLPFQKYISAAAIIAGCIFIYGCENDQKAIDVWGNGEWKDVSDPNQPHEAGLLKLDIKRALTELQWQPKLNAASAIEWTVNWYKQPGDKKADYTFQQIKDYFLL